MARVAVPITQFQRSGTDMPVALAGDVVEGNTMDNDGRTGLIVTNTSVSTVHNVTFTLFRTVDGQAVAPRVEAVPAGQSQGFGPFLAADYGGKLAINVDHAELKLQAVRI